MIEAPLANPTNSHSEPAGTYQGHESENQAQCFCRATETPVGPTSKRSDEDTVNKPRARPTLFRIIMVAAFAVFLTVAARSVLVSPLETRLLAEQAQSLAKDLDAVLAVRGAAINMAAGTLDIDNLSASGGLERLLTTLRTILPDFSSLEIVNDQGQTLAMMGNVALSFIGQPVDREALGQTDAKESSQKVLFLDDPGNQGFFIIMSHTTHDGRAWYSRTRFSHKPIDIILKSAGAEMLATLLPLASESAKESATAAGASAAEASGTSPVKRGQVSTTKRWWGETSGAEATLKTPGWRLSIERTHPSLAYFAQVLIPGLLVLLIGLIYPIASARSRGGKVQPTGLAAVRPATEVKTKSAEPPLVVQPAVAEDPIPANETEWPPVTETAETLSAGPPEYIGLQAPSEPCKEDFCLEETNSEDKIPETLDVTWFETVSIFAGETEDSEQEPVRTNSESQHAMIFPQICA